ncbi:hypothetical protein NDU88_010065 [Pleurodeles waltl]|uniref:Uncharacterized protein n=1 Tax=Pleurodeles waltl TaxID=8319 RepID=A0AAV7RXW8_PLEWA|nr:hypothetical protein NDU88_010065 [Pleurodeles waltl]
MAAHKPKPQHSSTIHDILHKPDQPSPAASDTQLRPPDPSDCSDLYDPATEDIQLLLLEFCRDLTSLRQDVTRAIFNLNQSLRQADVCLTTVEVTAMGHILDNADRTACIEKLERG